MHDLLAILDELNVEHTVVGRGSRPVPFAFDTIRPASQSSESAAVFVKSAAGVDLETVKAAVLIVPRREAVVAPAASFASIVAVDDPRATMQKVLARISPVDQPPPGIDPTARVAEEALIHPSVSIGPFAIVGRCTIGEGSRIGAYTRIHDRVEIGDNVLIYEHCVIGGQGFGFTRDADARLHHIPHAGGVRIENDVEIFPFANVDSGTLIPTTIGRGTKIDHYCHIGHNTTIGADSLITAGTVLCGGSSVRDRAWLGVGSIVKQGVIVGNGSTVGLGAVVIRDVDADETVAGVPAKPLTPREGSARKTGP